MRYSTVVLKMFLSINGKQSIDITFPNTKFISYSIVKDHVYLISNCLMHNSINLEY